MRIPRKRHLAAFSPESTGKHRGRPDVFPERSRRRPTVSARLPGRRRLWLAALIGVLWALLWQAPASWLAQAVWRASAERVLLAQAQGTWRDGSALLVLEGGRGSRGATVLPGTLRWRIALGGLWRGRLTLRLDWPAVSAQPLLAQAHLGWSRWTAALRPEGGNADSPWQGVLPLTVLDGLGTPWNTVALRGQAQITLSGVHLESAAGRMRFAGRAQIALPDVASRLSPLSPIGSYALAVAGHGADAGVTLRSDKGPLLLQGEGVWNGQALRFSGTARAAPGSEAALVNLLPIFGQREGDHVRIAI